MREKNKRRKIRTILVVIIILIVAIFLSVIKMFDCKVYKSDNSIDKHKKIVNNVEDIKDEKDLEKIVEDMGEESTTEKIETEVDHTPKANNNSNSNQKASNRQTNTTKSNKDNSNTSTPNQTTTNTTKSNNEVKQTQPSVDLTKVASTNDIYYGIHRGIVEFSTNSGCDNAGRDIVDIELNQVIAYNAENDNTRNVDIQYHACYQVTSQANTIMGYYLNIYCESGNCNRYKSLINISNYN